MKGKKKAKPVEYYDATLPDGTKLPVPRGMMGSDLQRYVQDEMRKRAEAAEAAETAQAAQLTELQNTQVKLTQMEALMAEQAKVIARLEEQNQKLQQASPDAAAGAMALMNATAQAHQLRSELMKDLGAASEWRQKFNDDIAEVATEVRRKNTVIDAEVADRKRRNKILFDDIRASQGLERQHPELQSEEVNDGE